jgi:hypothetical protein
MGNNAEGPESPKGRVSRAEGFYKTVLNTIPDLQASCPLGKGLAQQEGNGLHWSGQMPNRVEGSWLLAHDGPCRVL